jgi:hypothetical protein
MTVAAAAEGEQLRVMLGECELDVAPAGPDAFKILGPTFGGAVFKFVIAPAGEVSGLRLEGDDDGETILFKR